MLLGTCGVNVSFSLSTKSSVSLAGKKSEGRDLKPFLKADACAGLEDRGGAQLGVFLSVANTWATVTLPEMTWQWSVSGAIGLVEGDAKGRENSTQSVHRHGRNDGVGRQRMEGEDAIL